jgi:hypothetical protein
MILIDDYHLSHRRGNLKSYMILISNGCCIVAHFAVVA